MESATHLPQIITDLALLLAVAAIATVVCRRTKQPLVLGYVVAGFIVSPANGWLPSITDGSEITAWADIGIIFLMFGLGLEFSFVKLSKVGKSAIIIALVEMVCMIMLGVICAQLMGWSTMDAIFLGGMLAISSTTIIIKAFDDLELKGRKFTQLVFGALVVEDIVGIFLMVLLSTIAISSGVNGGEVAVQISQMALYLVLWFVASIVLVPSLLRVCSRFINNEIMLIASIALCFCMVVLANTIGFSAALGAFLAGSVLAGTMQSHRIEALFKPVKDLFGAIFFVSVGMLVAPDQLVEYLIPIIVIAVITLVFKPLFTSLGALLAKQNMKISIKTGMSLSQIGEFSFIIAGLGVSLGVTSDFLYPVIVAVSVITTLTTPFFIKSSNKTYSLIEKIAPSSFIKWTQNRSEKSESKTDSSHWFSYFKTQVANFFMVIIVSILMVSVGLQVVAYLDTLVDPNALRIIMMVLGVFVVGIFVSNLNLSTRNSNFAMLWFESNRNRFPLVLTIIMALIVSFVSIGAVILVLGDVTIAWTLTVSALVVFLFSYPRMSKVLNNWFLGLKMRFVSNLNEQELHESISSRSCADMQRWIEESLGVVEARVVSQEAQDDDVLPSRMHIFLRRMFKMHLIRVSKEIDEFIIPTIAWPELGERGHARKLVFIGASTSGERDLSIEGGDVLYFLGRREDAQIFLDNLENETLFDVSRCHLMSLRGYLTLEEDRYAEKLICVTMQLAKRSRIRGKTIATSKVFADFGCIIVAIERNALPVLNPKSTFSFRRNDTVWVLGEKDSITRLIDAGYFRIKDDCPVVHLEGWEE